MYAEVIDTLARGGAFGVFPRIARSFSDARGERLYHGQDDSDFLGGPSEALGTAVSRSGSQVALCETALPVPFECTTESGRVVAPVALLSDVRELDDGSFYVLVKLRGSDFPGTLYMEDVRVDLVEDDSGRILATSVLSLASSDIGG